VKNETRFHKINLRIPIKKKWWESVKLIHLSQVENSATYQPGNET
jgi:hypothetical protein